MKIRLPHFAHKVLSLGRMIYLELQSFWESCSRVPKLYIGNVVHSAWSNSGRVAFATQPPCDNPIEPSALLATIAIDTHGSQKTAFTLEQLFSDNNLIAILSRMRAKIAKSRHDKDFASRLCKPTIKVKSKKRPDAICDMLPPRNVWSQYRIRKRDGKDTLYLNAKAIERAARDRLSNPGENDAKWIAPFYAFASHLRNRALNSPNFRFQTPTVRPVPKDKDGNHRALAVYCLEDRIISTLLTRYLRERFDDQLSDSSYAYREPKNGTCTSHHDAIDDIYAFHEKHTERSLWVAECDIRGFFDCIHHDIVRAAFSEFASNATNAGKTVEPRAEVLFYAYLQSYTFTQNVLREALPRLQARSPNATIKWHLDALKEFYSDPMAEPIGISQGGAVSSLIANIVLNQVDIATIPLRISNSKWLHYGRFCDDMILISPSRKLLERSFSSYLTALRSIYLPVYEPEVFGKYDKAFWGIKSKAPYNWYHNPGADGTSPWIGFVGYQIRCDGLIRIRKDSIARHHEKIIATANQILWTIFEKPRNGVRLAKSDVLVTRRQALYRLKGRLISSSVGRPRIGNQKSRQSTELCWAYGFRGLKGKNIDLSQMRRLDRQRGRQIARVKSAMIQLVTIAIRSSVKPDVRYHGTPFSYYGQFKQKHDR